MKAKTNFKKGSRMAWYHYTLHIKSLILSAFILTGIQATLQAQEIQFTKPSWWFGAAAGANFNYYTGSTQELNSEFTAPAAFHNGYGLGLYLAPLLEFHRPDSRLGFMLQAGYDSRKGSFKRVWNPCDCLADLSVDLNYITVEPSLRFAPFKSNFYLYGGPRLAFNLAKEFTYTEGEPFDPDLSYMRKALISMQIAAGYDIPLSSQNKEKQSVLSPFISFQPYFGQNPRSIETWTVSTVRVGAALKFGRGHKIPVPVVIAPVIVVVEPDVRFTVISPTNIPVERRVRETFPVRNYVFFDLGSTEIPDRYVLLTKDQVKDFRQDRLEVFTPKRLAGRSKRQMIVYYNVLNILSDRMLKNPSSTITLVGSSEKGPKDGMAMAGSIKQYIASIFGIDASRIKTEGRVKPKLPSEKPGGTKELVLLREGDRRVSVESSSPAMLVEYQTGPDFPLAPVEIVGVQEAPLDSYVTFNVDGATEAFSSWSLEIRDEKGTVQKFGPYTQETVSIPGKSILGARPAGDFNVTMVGERKSGNTLKKEAPVHIVLWTPPENEEMLRFSVIFEFNESQAINIYDKFLTDIVTPKIFKDGTVIIHGHTDIIGEVAHNQELSLARANEVRSIIEKALSNTGRSDVKFEVYGFGEDESLAPFANKFAEERFYNRTVIIDIIPPKK